MKVGFSTFSQSGKTIGQSIGLAFQIMDDILITAKAKVPWVSLSLKMSSRGLLTAVVVGTEKERAVLTPLLEKKPR